MPSIITNKSLPNSEKKNEMILSIPINPVLGANSRKLFSILKRDLRNLKKLSTNNEY